MATCIVTGGAGFLGSHLSDHLLASGHRVICVDNLDTGSLQNIHHIRDESEAIAHIHNGHSNCRSSLRVEDQSRWIRLPAD